MAEVKQRQPFVPETNGRSVPHKERPLVAISSSPDNEPHYRKGKVVHIGFADVSTSLPELDSYGAMQHSKVVEGLSLMLEMCVDNKSLYLARMITGG